MAAEATVAARGNLRKPVFEKVDELQPGTTGHTMVVKVVSSKLVLQRARPNPTGNVNFRQVRIAECVVGDDTGVIIFTARNEQVVGVKAILGFLFQLSMSGNLCLRCRGGEINCPLNSPGMLYCVLTFIISNEQVDIMKEGVTVIIRNAKIDMYKGTMRLAVDKWGRVEVTEPASFTVNGDNNLSAVEYEL
ncbi:hypothetical protein KI387_011715, partial [Taxus chinensis]